MRQEIKDSFKDLMATCIKNYITSFCIVSIVITVLAAFKVGMVLWLMKYALCVWLTGEVIVFMLSVLHRCFKKLINRSE